MPLAARCNLQSSKRYSPQRIRLHKSSLELTPLMTGVVAPSPSATASSCDASNIDSTPIHLQLGPWSYRLVWWSLVAVYAFVGFYLLVQVLFYLVSTTWPKAGYIAETYQLLPLAGFRVAMVAYGYMWIFVTQRLVHVVRLSLQARRLCVSSAELPQVTTAVSSLHQPPALAEAANSQLPFSFSGAYFHYTLQRVKQYVHVRGQGYEVGKLVRDLLQISSLSIQAYDSSQYSVEYELILTYVVLVAIACLSGPAIELMRLRSLAHERFATLVVDLFIDSTYLLLPMLLFGPYMEAYAGEESCMFQDHYNARAIMELRIIFVASFFNLAVKLVPLLGMLATTDRMRQLVRRHDSTASSGPPAQEMDNNSILTTNQDAAKLPATKGSHRAPSGRLLRQISASFRPASGSLSRLVTTTPPRQSTTFRIIRRLFSILMVTWGIVASIAFSVTLHSETQCPSGCALILHPWFESTQCRCAVQIIDCHTRGIQGREHEIQAIFTTMESVGLATLIFLHCSALEIPPEVHWFRDLYQFEIYNSSIVSWPVSAALSSEYYRRLGMVYLVRTNLSSVPEALLSEPLPKTLKEIGIVVSRLTSLPEDLHEKWSHVQTLSLDHGQFSTFPLVLGRMKLKSLAMYNNSLTSIPEDAFLDCAFQYLLLNGNPLTSIPNIIGRTERLYEVQLQNTNISSLALSWSQALFAPTTKIYARGSPICGDGNHAVETQEGVAVLCSERHSVYGGQYSLSYYTLEGKTEERLVHS